MYWHFYKVGSEKREKHMPKAKFTSALSRFFPNLKDISTSSGTIKDTISEVENHYPGIQNFLIDQNGQLRDHVNIYIGSQLIKDRKDLSDVVEENDEVYFFQAISGG